MNEKESSTKCDFWRVCSVFFLSSSSSSLGCAARQWLVCMHVYITPSLSVLLYVCNMYLHTLLNPFSTPLFYLHAHPSLFLLFRHAQTTLLSHPSFGNHRFLLLLFSSFS